MKFMAFCCAFLGLMALAAAASAPQEPAAAQPSAHVSAAAIESAIGRGAKWLSAQQSEDGSFVPSSERDVCRVAISAMATWSLNEAGSQGLDASALDRAAGFLLSNRHADGGIYDPERGLAVYTSGVAARALRSLGRRDNWPELAKALSEAQLFSYRHGTPESILDAVKPGEIPLSRSVDAARALLAGTTPLEQSRRRALEFLARSRQDQPRAPTRLRTSETARDTSEIGPFSYDDLLPLVYLDLAPEQQIALRARAALVAHYTPNFNPDLTQRYGSTGFRAGTQGLFCYYFVAAKTLATFAQPTLVTADGTRHDWASELGSRLIRMQNPDGSWSNSATVWWEGEPVIATSYALLTLRLCRAASEVGR